MTSWHVIQCTTQNEDEFDKPKASGSKTFTYSKLKNIPVKNVHFSRIAGKKPWKR